MQLPLHLQLFVFQSITSPNWNWEKEFKNFQSPHNYKLYHIDNQPKH